MIKDNKSRKSNNSLASKKISTQLLTCMTNGTITSKRKERLQSTMNSDLSARISQLQSQIVEKKILDRNKYIMNAKNILGQ